MKKNGSFLKIGTIDDNTGTIVNVLGNMPYHLKKINDQILDYIKNVDSYSDNVDKIITSGDITCLIFKVLRWRRCTGFLVLQISNVGLRTLCYLYDKVVHNAVSFGTDIYHVKMDYIHKQIESSLKNNEKLKEIINNYLIKVRFGI